MGTSALRSDSGDAGVRSLSGLLLALLCGRGVHATVVALRLGNALCSRHLERHRGRG